MSDTIIVGFILALAAFYVIYRLFFRPSCGCGGNCGNSCCSAKNKNVLEKKYEEISVDKHADKKECCGNSSCHCGK